MNRFLSALFLVLAVLLAGFAFSFVHYLNQLGAGLGFHARTVWACLAAALVLALAAWRLPVKAKFLLFMLMISLVLVESLLQAAAWAGVLPGVNTKLKVPYARVYWTAEGRGNSIRNRFGWYYPAFNLKAPHKIAFIGDSQVEAVEVAPTRNQAAVLQDLLRQNSLDWSVLGLGSHGTCPAHSIDVLEYAARHFDPQEAIIVVSLGSDITEASPLFNGFTPDQFIYYDLAPDGTLVLNPGSAPVRERFDRMLELNHQSVFTSLPMTVISHCMTMQLAVSLRDAFALRRRQAEFAARAGKLQAGEGAEFRRLGFNPTPFAVHPEPEAQRALAILLAQLNRCREICDSHHMKLRLVTLPSFPETFYKSQTGTNWTMHIGDYDYLGPERQVMNFAATNGIPALALGEYFQHRNLTAEAIRTLYLSNGLGHLSEKGHRFCAGAIYEAFYANPAHTKP